MNKVLLVYDIPGWAYWRRANALKKHQPDDFECETMAALDVKWQDTAFMQKYDLVFLIEYTHAKLAVRGIKDKKLTTKLVISHNADSRRKQDLLAYMSEFADFVIVNNRDGWQACDHKNACCISNGIDFDDFYYEKPIEERDHKAIWCGSSGARKKKGYADILLPAVSLLRDAGIATDFRPIDGDGWDREASGAHTPKADVVFPTKEQRDWYNSASYVICVSETEGTPNFLLEAAACGCVPVSTHVGNLPEFGKKDESCVWIDRKPSSIVEGVLKAKSHREEMSAAIRKALEKWSYVDRAPYFFNVFRKIIKGEKVERFSFLDIDASRV